MNVLGLDLSLTATGYAVPGLQGVIKPPGSARKGMARLDHIRSVVIGLIDNYGIGLVMVEGYSFASRQSHAHALGELGGLIRWSLWKCGVGYVDVSPSTLKMFATGKGNAPKNAVLAEAINRLGYEGHDDNEADALWLQELGVMLLGDTGLDLPKTHLRALEKVELP